MHKMIQQANHMMSCKPIPVPPLLQEIPDAPGQLYTLGNSLTKLLRRPRVAIVGSRKMTPYGRVVTEKLATELAGQGIVVVSGLAYGVDACAHRAALAVGGQCIAVLANGLDTIYPAGHTRLGKEIIKSGGVIVSEYAPGTPPMQHRFLERNRLVAGLAGAVLITEAAERSGTLNTTAHALNQGKPVLAVPGNITSALSVGTNNILKSGAHPVTSVTDILAMLNINPTEVGQAAVPIAVNDQEAILLKLLSEGMTDGSELLRHSQLETAVFNQTLTMLEITAKIRPLGANHWRLA